MSVESALREVRPDDLDAIFDGALFGPPALEAELSEEAAEAERSTPVPVGAVEWFVERDEQAAGPLRLERLRELWHHGDLSPDTLCWCEAWPGWRPLSRVPELVVALTDAGLPTVGAGSSVAPAPAKQTDSEAKKVVPALPSLVEAEEAWLRKMQEEKEQAKEEARAALLDAPVPPVVAPHLAPAPAPAPVPVPMPVPMVSPLMAAPIPAEAPVPSRRGRKLVVGALLGTTAVGLIVGALLLLPRIQLVPEREPEASPRPVASSAEPSRASAPIAVQPVAPAPAPVLAQPPAPVVQAPVKQEKQEAKVVTASAQSEPPRKVAVAEAVAPVTREKEGAGRRMAASRPEESPAAVGERIANAAESALQRRSQPPPSPVAPPRVDGRKALQDDASAEDPTNFDDSLDKEFEKELGFAKDSPKHKPEDPRSKRTVYLPPEPGEQLPETLSTSAVLEVVSSHKAAIVSCIQEHRPPMSESGKGRFVMRWRVQPGGTATEVLMETESLRGTPFARCIEGEVRSWKFPRHRVQSPEPVRFPFTY